MINLLLPPLLGGVIGYLTNDIAIRMLFRPHRPKYLFGFHIPFTPGIIPKEKGRIARAMGEAISENLMNKEVLERALLSDEIIESLKSGIDSFCREQENNQDSLLQFLSKYLSVEEISNHVSSAEVELRWLIQEKLCQSSIGDKVAHIAVARAMEKVSGGLLGLFGANKLLEPVAAKAEVLLSKEINEMMRENAPEMIGSMIKEQTQEILNTPMQTLFTEHREQIAQAKESIISVYRTIILEHLPKMLSALNISQMIENRINEMDMNEIEPLILQVIDKELKAIVWFGAGLGALIGCVNLFV